MISDIRNIYHSKIGEMISRTIISTFLRLLNDYELETFSNNSSVMEIFGGRRGHVT